MSLLIASSFTAAGIQPAPSIKARKDFSVNMLEDFGEILTPELRAQNEHVRAEADTNI
ncbi:MAG: hypothetical protein ABSF46_10090 [Terriglobia bacterium]|jgi:hypothetical protein